MPTHLAAWKLGCHLEKLKEKRVARQSGPTTKSWGLDDPAELSWNPPL